MSAEAVIPEPGKRGFGWPLPAAALDYFVHPVSKAYGRPMWNPADGMVYCFSAFGALRTRRFSGNPLDFPEMRDVDRLRAEAVPWDTLREHGQRRDAWRLMDDSRGTLFRDPPGPLYVFREFRWHRTEAMLVRVAGAPILPLALLQAVSRLPRVEICTIAPRVESPVFFRFNGEGEMVVPHLGHTGGARFELFKPKNSDPLLPGGLL